MKYIFALCVALGPHIAGISQPFTFESIKGYPFPTELTASATGARIAWAFDERGIRNVYVAEGPSFKARKLTSYTSDDGSGLSLFAAASMVQIGMTHYR
jgi:hypothetical protein